MKKLVDLLREISSEQEKEMERGQVSNGYRKNVTTDRVTKYGGSVPADWKDRKPGVDFEPNPELLAIRGDYEKGAQDKKERGVSNRPKGSKSGRSWGFRDWVLFPAKSDVFLSNKEEIIEVLRNFIEDTIKDLEATEKYQELSDEDLQKVLGSLKMDNAGNIHYYGPYDISYKRIGRPALSVKGDEISGVNPDSLGKVRKTQIFPKDLINQKQLKNRIAKPEDEEQ